MQSEGKPMFLFTYSTIAFAKKDKVRFYYALKGRDGKSGILHSTKSIQLGRTVLMVPIDGERDFIQFFEVWKLPFTKRKIMVLEEESVEQKP